MINRVNIIEKVRLFMKKENINFLIISSTDRYLNEYIDLASNSRYILTGFTGSTGDALITPDEIFLFVDGRYHLQADEQTDKDIINVVKVGINKSPATALYEKIAELSDGQAKIGIISRKTGCFGFRKLLDIMSDKNAEFVELDFDPVEQFSGIENNEALSQLRYVSEEISGLTPEEKLGLIIAENEKMGIDLLVVTKLEEIAWLTNIRGSDIPFSSSFTAKLIVNAEKCFLFTDLNRITKDIKQKLGSKFIFDDGDFNLSFLKDIEKLNFPANIGYNLNSINLSDCRKLEKTNHKLIEIKDSPIALLKSIKNSQELNHIQDCFMHTDIAVNRLISWLNQRLEQGEKISEKQLSDKLKSLFYEEGAVGLSFETIAASGRNTAFIHYTNANAEKFISEGELVLLDCGAYFEGGYATDITRTFLAGGSKTLASQKQKEIYTRVLKAFLNGINYEIDESTTGFDIDKKVREIIDYDKPEGFNFSHGTGHGIGISVHEAPPRLGPSEISATKLLPGMCFTIEPGLYCDEWGGVRIENTVCVVEQDGILKIKTMTRSPLDDNLIDYSFLSDQEKFWLESYQKYTIG